MNKDPEVKIAPEKLDPAFALVQKHVPEFAEIKLEDVKL